MKVRTAFKLIGRGFDNLWRHKGSSLAALVSITIALVVLGFYALTWFNIMNLTDSLLDNLEIRVFLKKPGTVSKIENLEGVEKSVYITPDKALNQMAESYQIKGEYLKNVLAENPLQASYSLKVKDSQTIPQIVEIVKAMPEVDDVVYGGQATDSLVNLQRISGGFGLLLFFILVVAISLIVANTLRLSFAIRKEEIALERLLGAGPLYVVSPFLWEGIILGLLSAGIAILIVLYSYKALIGWALISLPYLPLKPLDSIKTIVISTGLILGFVISFIGSVWGVRRYWPKD
jgi:cell division transport system permease protein